MRSLIILLLAVVLVNSLRFYVPPKEKKCLKEEIHKNVVVTGEYEFSQGIQYTGSIHVRFFFKNLEKLRNY